MHRFCNSWPVRILLVMVLRLNKLAESIVSLHTRLLRPSVSNGSGPSLCVRVQVQTELLPNWWSGSSMNPNCQLRYRSMVHSQPV